MGAKVEKRDKATEAQRHKVLALQFYDEN